MKRSLALNFFLNIYFKKKKLETDPKRKEKRWTYENMAHFKTFKHS